jgi:alpha-L-fucosidase 2
MKFISIILVLLISYFTGFAFRFSPDKTLWYITPGNDWTSQSLHIGNGYMGASFYGGVEKEQFDIAEKTFWTGGPNVTPDYNYGIIDGGKDHIGEIRNAIVNNRIAESDSLVRKYMKGNYNGFGYFSKVGNLIIEFPQIGKPTDYVRGLNLDKALGFVQYKINDVNYSREYFCSYPDKVMAIRLSADKKGRLNFSIYQEMEYKVETINILHDNEMVISGLIEASGLKYCARIKILNSGGEITSEQGKFEVKNADNVTILYTVATEYDAKAPMYKGVSPFEKTGRVISKIAADTYESIKTRHVLDYQALFNRVSFSLAGDSKLETLPTNERVDQLKGGMTDDSALKALWFNFGRYLLISASRPGTLPSTLQGVWNGMTKSAWSGNYQSNINLQEMYWGAGPTNLPECQEAYIEWVENQLEPGHKVAQAYYGTKGWVHHATGNIWGFAAPGTDLKWGMYPVGGVWHCRHLWDQYDFIRDYNYLKNRAYPIMKDAALFCLENLMMYDGSYVLTPSSSAEHGIEIKEELPVAYSTVNGEQDAHKLYTYPAFQDVEMVYDLFTNVMKASAILKTDNEFCSRISEARNKLMKLRVGKYGQLQEWVIDADNPRDHHRHIAHLYALYPGEMITPTKTPELFQAAKKSLNMRGEGFLRDRWYYAGGNWSMAWRIACWTRLLDGERAMKIYNLMIKENGFGNMMTAQVNNMQVDATMATPGLFAEMIMQSHDGFIHLLPAIPSEWPEGEVKGLVARGGYKVNIWWKNGQLEKAEVTVPQGMPEPKLKLNNKEIASTDHRIGIIKI